MNYWFSILSLIILIFSVIWWFLFCEKIGQEIPNSLLRKYSKFPFLLLTIWLIRGTIFVLLLSLFIDPQIIRNTSVPIGNEGNIAILLDISRSMQTDDIAPNRLEKAKELIETFLGRKELGNIGYIAFAGKPFVLSPLTADKEGLGDILRNTTSSTINQGLKDTSGTNIGDAIIEANLMLSGAIGNGEKSIILITDGRANIGIDPLIAAKESKENGIHIYSIAVGSSSGSLLSYKNNAGKREYFYDEVGKPLKADVDEIMLRQIAESTQGKYFRAEDGNILDTVFQDLNEIFTPIVSYKNVEQSIPLTPIFFGIIILLALIHEGLSFLLRKTYKVE